MVTKTAQIDQRFKRSPLFNATTMIIVQQILFNPLKSRSVILNLFSVMPPLSNSPLFHASLTLDNINSECSFVHLLITHQRHQ